MGQMSKNTLALSFDFYARESLLFLIYSVTISISAARPGKKQGNTARASVAI